ncbi:MAG TPA: hypothetical protein VFZ32_00550 [Micromonosporaceae bacterium]
MTDPADTDPLAWLCEHLPGLQRAADQDRWRHKLNAAVEDIRAGSTVHDAFARHHLPPLGISGGALDRSDPWSPDLAGITAIVGDADPVDCVYVCPRTKQCGRRGVPDRKGRDPVCAVDNAPMTARQRE